MHTSSGGQNTGNVINRWGKTDNPNAHRSSRLGNRNNEMMEIICIIIIIDDGYRIIKVNNV